MRDGFYGRVKRAQIGQTPTTDTNTTSQAYRIGEMVEGEGVFVGVWKLKSINKTFNLFAAPEDLKLKNGKPHLMKDTDAIRHVGKKIKDCHGYNGGMFETSKTLIGAVKSGDYNGEWFVPSVAILQGMLYEHKDKGVLNGTFNENCRYASSSISTASKKLVSVNFADGSLVDRNGGRKLATRLVRAVPI